MRDSISASHADVGLSEENVLESREAFGSNKIPERRQKTAFDFFRDAFKDRLNQILIGMMLIFTGLACFGQGSFSEPLGIFVVLLAIAVISTKTGIKSQKSAKELKDETSVRYCNVLRDGQIKHINTEEIVVGDIIRIESGESIYADGYLIDGRIAVDNSVLNGESKECKKHSRNWFEYPIRDAVTGDDYVDAHSLFAGQTIVDGEGTMIVTKVGKDTINGQTIMSMDEIEEVKTSLEIQLDDLAGSISKFGTVSAVVIAVAALTSHIMIVGGVDQFLQLGWMPALSKILTVVTTSLTIVVAAVPEGLPLIISLITSQNAKRMLKHNVLAKHTNKIPEAGNIQLLCTDKTGTLTKGVLQPVHHVKLDGIEITNWNSVPSVMFFDNIYMNSVATFDADGKVVGGNATERALLGMGNKDDYDSVHKDFKVIKRKAFNSTDKYSAVETVSETIFGDDDDDNVITYYKGAPEKLLSVAKGYTTADGGIFSIDDDVVRSVISSFTTKAMRVIATAYSRSPLGDDLPKDLVMTSLVAIRDDVREEVPEAVKKMHDAGVQVMMVTGDVIETAVAIAHDSGLIRSKDDIAISATDFDKMPDEEAKAKLSHIKVVARATPQTKLRIIRLAQEQGLCVAMTGDGTNDAPALKAADVGFSMGSGTDVCKEAGDIIITDDNFVSITDAVLLGRTFMHNVLKFLKFQLPINIALVIISVIYSLFFGVEAIAAVQILIINIVMDSLNSLSFGGEPPKDEYMFERPIEKGSKLLSKSTVSQIAVSVVTFLTVFGITALPVVRGVFGSEQTYETMRFALLVIMATVNGFNIRTDSLNLFKGIGENPMFAKIAIAIFVCTVLLCQFGGSMLHCTPMSLVQWVVVFALSLIVIPVDLIRKSIVNERKK